MAERVPSLAIAKLYVEISDATIKRLRILCCDSPMRFATTCDGRDGENSRIEVDLRFDVSWICGVDYLKIEYQPSPGRLERKSKRRE